MTCCARRGARGMVMTVVGSSARCGTRRRTRHVGIGAEGCGVIAGLITAGGTVSGTTWPLTMVANGTGVTTLTMTEGAGGASSGGVCADDGGAAPACSSGADAPGVGT